MSELEEKLNKILSSPAELEKIMGIAKSLSGSLGTQPSTADGATPTSDLSALASSFKDIDPRIFGLVTRLLSEYTSAKNDKTELLNAIKPYLKEDRRDKIDKAAEIAKITRLAKLALREFSRGDGNV